MKSITPSELEKCLESGDSVRLLDVREEGEWAICSIPGGILRPLSRAEAWLAEEAQSAEPVVIYCHHGIRSARVCEALRHLGKENVRNLTGGIDAWRVDVNPSMPAY